jgi:hypothetical protein
VEAVALSEPSGQLGWDGYRRTRFDAHAVRDLAEQILGYDPYFVVVSSFRFFVGLDVIDCYPEGGGVRHDGVHDAGSKGLTELLNFDQGVDEVDQSSCL